jgi:hypothetical protein
MVAWVEHLVLCKFSRMPTAAEAAKVQALSALPGVTFVSAGENYTARGQGYNYAVCVRFISKEAEAAYQTHPEHVKVRDEVIVPLLQPETKPLVVDYQHEQPLNRGLLLGLAVGLCLGVVLGRLRS